MGSYEFDGQAAVVSKAADLSLEKLFVYGGTYLTDVQNDRPLVQNVPAYGGIEAVYLDSGATIALCGKPSSNEVVLFAPNAQQLLINGFSTPFEREGDYITFKYAPAVHLPFIAVVDESQ